MKEIKLLNYVKLAGSFTSKPALSLVPIKSLWKITDLYS